MEIEVFILFHISFPQAFFEAGFHISPSVILDKDIGLSQDSNSNQVDGLKIMSKGICV